MTIEASLLIPATIINIIMGLVVLLRSPNRTSSRYFAISALWIGLWAIGGFLMLGFRDPAAVKIGELCFYIAPMWTTLYMVFFSRVFPENSKLVWYEKTLFLMVTTLWSIAIILHQNFLIDNIIIQQHGDNIVQVNQFGYTLYSLYFSAYFITAYVNFFLKLRHQTGYKRNQVLYSFVGIFLTSFAALVTNLTWPVLGTSAYIWLGPLFTLFYMTTTTVAIVKHHLFDIRLVVARSVTYILLLATLALAYAVLGFALSSFLFGTAAPDGREVVYVLLAVFLSFSFQPLKRFFDRVTDRIFFHNEYNLQTVLEEIGAVTANEIELKRVSTKTMDILNKALKTEFVSMFVLSAAREFEPYRFHVGNAQRRMDRDQEAELFTTIGRLKEAIIIADQLDNAQASLQKLMNDANIAAIVRLETSRELIGHLFFGPKQTGSMYSVKDVQLLGTVAGELALAVQNSLRFQEIRDFNETLQERVNVATAELRRSNAKLHQLDNAKDEFISMASHQLRTPLTTVKGYLSMVLEGDAGNISPLQRKLLGEAFASSQRMVGLISDFLNVSRLQTGKFVLEPTSVNLSVVVQDEVKQLEATARARNLKLRYAPPSHFPAIRLDDNKIRQVIMNLIDNAIYYSHEGGTITIELLQVGHDAVFRVKDQGIGVPADERHHLFTKFFRATNARQARPDGTGIGLFMAKKVVVAHGGSILFESNEGKGSTFGFQLPLETHLKAPKKLN